MGLFRNDIKINLTNDTFDDAVSYLRAKDDTGKVIASIAVKKEIPPLNKVEKFLIECNKFGIERPILASYYNDEWFVSVKKKQSVPVKQELKIPAHSLPGMIGLYSNFEECIDYLRQARMIP